MQSYYEIIVSKNGCFIFATDKRSATDIWQAKKVYKLLKEKFPKSEGYSVNVTYWDCLGHAVASEELEESK